MPPDFVYELPEIGMFLVVLLVTGVVAAIVHLMFLLPSFRRASQRAADISPTIQALCGTLFVLSVTFLANSVWQSEQRAREAVHGEARSIRTIRTYMGAMVGTSEESLLRIIGNYAKAVESEWPHTWAQGGNARSEAELKEIYNAVILGLAEGDQNRLLQQRILAALDALSTARQQRLSLAREEVSGGQWFMVSALAVLLIVVISLSHGRFPDARLAALAAISLAISIALFVILSHDRPFVGYLAITPNSILEAAAAEPAA